MGGSEQLTVQALAKPQHLDLPLSFSHPPFTPQREATVHQSSRHGVTP